MKTGPINPPDFTGAGAGIRFRRLVQRPRDLSGVKEKKKIHQPAVIVVHDDVLESRGDRFVISVAVGHHPPFVVAVAVQRSVPVLRFSRDQSVEIAAELEHSFGQQQRVTPGNDPFLVTSKDGEWCGQRCGQHRKEIAPITVDLVLSQIDGLAELFPQDLPESVNGLLVPRHPTIVSAGRSRSDG